MPSEKIAKSSKDKTNKDGDDVIDVEDVYKSKTLHQSILDSPDTYIGPSKPDDVRMFIWDEDNNKIVEEVINYVGGFFKIFDEILVNARDHTVRDPTCRNIKVNLDKKTGIISVWNDGSGIPIMLHKKFNKYVPEVIFGNLLTSQNYNKTGKIVGGKNGYGSKVANIYSTMFKVHTVGLDNLDEKKGKKVEYTQTFRDNMYKVEEPVINKKISQSAKTFTEITFLPDYERFGMTGLTNDMYSLLVRRCYDVAACTPKNVSFTVNEKDIKCRDFKDYIKLYYSDEEKPKITYEKFNSRWEVGIGFNKNIGDRYISFVNGISTFQGGTHVRHVVDNVVAKVTAHIKKKKEYKDLKILPNTIKQYLTFFINCIVEDPTFNSQTKEFMNSKISDWCTCGNNCKDVKCDITDDFIEKLCSSGLMTEVVKMSEFKELRDLGKTDGKKVGNLRSIEKLIDAEWAGKRKSDKTSLFLTEGDSAKAFAVAGISVIGNEKYGVFPLRGKLLNVRNATAKQIKENKEFVNIKMILGLKQGVKYHDVSKLRYGSVIILTDQDPDGSHIKGLIINMLEYFWPELLQIEGFIKAYNTPIVKAWKKSDKKRKEIKKFYSFSEFESWKKKQGDKISLWDHKYYKGLGTSTDKEAKESFKDFEDNLVTFEWEPSDNNDNPDNEEVEKLKNELKKKTDKSKKEEKKEVKNNENEEDEKLETKDTESDAPDDEESSYEYMKSRSHMTITKAFDKNQASARKEWLRRFKQEDILEYGPKMKVKYSDFIDKDLIHFSNLDNIRSIPALDGFKPSQRMIMYCCFKRGRRAKEIKVAQLSGYVSENTDYHHGEASLQGAIIGLAQMYPGSNNINLLRPNGNFGYRRQGGKDHASPRYIFTELDPVTLTIFRQEDEEILTYNYDDDRQVEPKLYAPIVPIILTNGASGIGTGFSIDVPPYNPRDVVANLKRMINGQEPVDMIPWYNGFKGSVERNPKDERKFIIKGKYNIKGSSVHIEDIPIVDGWIEPYEAKMEAKISVSKDDNNKIESISKNPSNNTINMVINFKGNALQELYKDDSLDKYLCMTQNLSVTNLNLFDADGKLVKYNSVLDILKDFYKYRMTMYEKRREYYLKKLENDLNISKYKVKFIREYLSGDIIIAKKKVDEVIDQLVKRKYPKLTNDHRDSDDKKSYRYLTGMHIITLTDDEIAKLEEEMKNCQAIYDEYYNTPIKNIYLKELDEFLSAYQKWEIWWKDENSIQDVADPDKDKKTSKNKSKKTSKSNDDNESESSSKSKSKGKSSSKPKKIKTVKTIKSDKSDKPKKEKKTKTLKKDK